MEYQIITNDETLAEFCAESRNAEYLSLDTEFVRTRTWFPLCGLIQICNGPRTVLVDPLEINNWQPFKGLLVNPNIVKVLHSCSEDLEVFLREMDIIPKPLFDTQFAACVAGIGTTMGYAKLVQELLGIELDKGESRTDWLKRPLRDAQLVYAANDVVYLHQVYPMLKEKLDALQRYDWVLMESEQLARKKRAGLPAEYRYLLVKNGWQLQPQSLGLLRDLAQWRYNTAIETDSAANFVVKEAAILEVARRMPGSMAKLSALGCMTHKEMRLYGELFIDFVHKASQSEPDSHPPKIKRLIDISSYKKICQSIRTDSVKIAEELDLPLEILSSKKQVNQYLKWCWFEVEECKIQGLEPDMMFGWRKDLFAETLKNYP